MNSTPSQYYQQYLTYMTNQDHAIMSLIYATIFVMVVYWLMRRLSSDPQVGSIMTFAARIFPYALLAAYAWLYVAAWVSL